MDYSFPEERSELQSFQMNPYRIEMKANNLQKISKKNNVGNANNAHNGNNGNYGNPILGGKLYDDSRYRERKVDNYNYGYQRDPADSAMPMKGSSNFDNSRKNNQNEIQSQSQSQR